VPVLLPTDDTAIRRVLDQWLDGHNVHPIVIGEFEDYALMREFARAGHGFMPVPAVWQEQFRCEYGLALVGPATGVEAQFFAISVERQIKHPAVAAIVQHGRKIFSACELRVIRLHIALDVSYCRFVEGALKVVSETLPLKPETDHDSKRGHLLSRTADRQD
jgi:LysR family transcriptional activator of nhaA